MKQFLSDNYKWIIFLVLLSAGSLSAELINHRLDMADLEVYYRAAERLLDGSELYREIEEDPYEHYVFKYAPPAALVFVPLLLFNFTLAKYIYWIILTFILGTVLYNTRSVFKTGNNASISLILGIAIVGTHFFRELFLGQVNLLLLGIYAYSLVLLNKRKAVLFSALLAISIFIKPFGLIFTPLLLIMGKFRELLYLLGFMAVLLLFPMIFYGDLNEYAGLYHSWFHELSLELGSKQDLLAAGNHTIFSVLARYTPLAFLNLEGFARIIYQLVILLLIGYLLLWLYFRRPVPGRDSRLYIILVALIPLLAYTSYNAFIFTLPLILFLLFKFKELNTAFRTVFVFSCILIGANIYDIAGPSLYDFLWGISVYTWGTLGLMLCLFVNWNKFSSH